MDPMRLDECVAAAASQLEEEGVAAPQILFLLGTGTGTMAGSLLGARQTHMGQVEGVPMIWGEQTLHSGRMGGLPIWLLEDAPGDLEFGEGGGPTQAPWERAFACSLLLGDHLCRTCAPANWPSYATTSTSRARRPSWAWGRRAWVPSFRINQNCTTRPFTHWPWSAPQNVASPSAHASALASRGLRSAPRPSGPGSPPLVRSSSRRDMRRCAT